MLRRFTFLLCLLSSAVYAQQPPTTGYVWPTSIPRGISFDVQLGGYDWTDDTQFFVVEDGVTIEVKSPLSRLLMPGPPHWFGPKATNKAFMIPKEVTARGPE